MKSAFSLAATALVASAKIRNEYCLDGDFCENYDIDFCGCECPGEWTPNGYDWNCAIYEPEYCLEGDFCGNFDTDFCGCECEGEWIANGYDWACGAFEPEFCFDGDWCGNYDTDFCGCECPGEWFQNGYDWSCTIDEPEFCFDGDMCNSIDTEFCDCECPGEWMAYGLDYICAAEFGASNRMCNDGQWCGNLEFCDCECNGIWDKNGDDYYCWTYCEAGEFCGINNLDYCSCECPGEWLRYGSNDYVCQVTYENAWAPECFDGNCCPEPLETACINGYCYCAGQCEVGIPVYTEFGVTCEDVVLSKKGKTNNAVSKMTKFCTDGDCAFSPECAFGTTVCSDMGCYCDLKSEEGALKDIIISGGGLLLCPYAEDEFCLNGDCFCQ